MRPSGRELDEMRAVSIETNVTKHAEGSCMIRCGDTHVLCTASLEERVPPWMRNSGQGWVTAEYGMLPRATHTRGRREAKNGQSGRTQEIQRLIGRSLRAAVDRNGFLPTHNQKYCHPQGRDPVWNNANCRNRRIFSDRTGLAAARNQKPFLLQTYRRDMGGGQFLVMEDLSAPIMVKGRHWGAFRFGLNV